MSFTLGRCQGFPASSVASSPFRAAIPPNPSEWPALWARCWSRIRTWRVPPRWSPGDWWDEVHAQGVLAACEALRAFEPGRLVPLDAFLYRRVVESVWSRYRQEWSFGRRCRTDPVLLKRPAAGSARPDPESLDRLAMMLGDLSEDERWLIRRLFWEGHSEDEIAFELGVTRQAVNKRKHKILLRLRSDFLKKELAPT
jgi:DNA-directed RNA polymerase specialized sigma24 family protein